MYTKTSLKCFVETCHITRPLLPRKVVEKTAEGDKERPVWVCHGHQWMTQLILKPQRPGKEASA